jgi:proteasome lid subunit RPN8/RPN11
VRLRNFGRKNVTIRQARKRATRSSRIRHAFLKSDLQKFQREARKAGRRLREVGGLIVDTGTLLRLVLLFNKATEALSYEADVEEVSAVHHAAKVLGMRVVGSFHSHVGGAAKPSQGDVSCLVPGDLLLLLQAFDGDLVLWRRSVHLRAHHGARRKSSDKLSRPAIRKVVFETR